MFLIVIRLLFCRACQEKPQPDGNSGGVPLCPADELPVISEFRASLIGLMTEKMNVFNDTALVACLLDPRTKNMMTANLFGFKLHHLQTAANLLQKHLEDSFDRRDSAAADQSAVIPVPPVDQLRQKPLGNAIEGLDYMLNAELNARPYFGGPAVAPDNAAKAQRLVTDWISANPDPGRTLQFKSDPRADDPLLVWWKQHEGTWPEIAEAARLFLAIPATSAPSERLFSTCRRVSSGDRANISPHRLEAVVRLHENHRKKPRTRTYASSSPAALSPPIDLF